MPRWFPGRHCIFIVLDIPFWRSVEKAEWGYHLAEVEKSGQKNERDDTLSVMFSVRHLG